MAQARGQGPRQALQQVPRQLPMLERELIKTRARENEDFGLTDGDGISRAVIVIEEGHLAEKIAAAESGKMVRSASVQRQHDAHRPTANEKERVAAVAAREDVLARLVRARLHAARERAYCLVRTRFQQLDLVQVERELVGMLERGLSQDLLLHPFERFIAMPKRTDATLAADQAHLIKEIL